MEAHPQHNGRMPVRIRPRPPPAVHAGCHSSYRNLASRVRKTGSAAAFSTLSAASMAAPAQFWLYIHGTVAQLERALTDPSMSLVRAQPAPPSALRHKGPTLLKFRGQCLRTFTRAGADRSSGAADSRWRGGWDKKHGAPDGAPFKKSVAGGPNV